MRLLAAIVGTWYARKLHAAQERARVERVLHESNMARADMGFALLPRGRA